MIFLILLTSFLGFLVLVAMYVTIIWASSVGSIEGVEDEPVPGNEVKTLTFNWDSRIGTIFPLIIGIWALSIIAEAAGWVCSAFTSFTYYNTIDEPL